MERAGAPCIMHHYHIVTLSHKQSSSATYCKQTNNDHITLIACRDVLALQCAQSGKPMAWPTCYSIETVATSLYEIMRATNKSFLVN